MSRPFYYWNAPEVKAIEKPNVCMYCLLRLEIESSKNIYDLLATRLHIKLTISAVAYLNRIFELS